MNRKQILIFGGSFNPPLNSHFSLAEQILNDYEEIEKIIFVPVNSMYEKAGLLSNEHRYNMLKLVCDNNDKFSVSRVELDNSKQLLTVETLRIFKGIYPEHEIVFLTGSDNLKEIEKWEKGDELLEEFRTYVLKRDTDDLDKIIKTSEFLIKYKASFIKAENKITSNLSSTFVRNALKDRKSVKYLIPEEILDYINKNKLYK